MTDDAMYAGIRSFQECHGLLRDGNSQKRYAPTLGRDRGVANSLADYRDSSDDAFREAARAAGLDPDRAMFIRDALRADKSQLDRLVERGYDLYGSAIGGLLHGTLEKIGWTDDPKTRREQLDPYLKYARPRGRGEKAGSAAGLAILGGAVGGKLGKPKRPPTDQIARHARKLLENTPAFARLPKRVRAGPDKGEDFGAAFTKWYRTRGSELEHRRKQNPTRNIQPTESNVWKALAQGKLPDNPDGKTNGLKKGKRRYYILDRGTGGHQSEIEVFDGQGQHLGTIDPVTTRKIRGPKAGRRIKVSLPDDLPDDLA